MRHSKSRSRGKFVAKQAYLQKQEKPQINHLTLYLLKGTTKSKTKPKVSSREEIKIRAEINNLESRKKMPPQK